MESMQVLVVSAQPDRRADLAAALRAAGVRVAAAENGTSGAVALTEPGIDVLVLDLRLTELDGSALRAALNPATPATPDSLDDAERRHITHVLRHTGGNKRQAAILLGISRSTLLHKVRKYGIVTERS
jgi:DNA-binding NtrC family response regulator